MRYIEIAEFLKRFPGFEEFENDDIETAIEDSTSIIDGYIKGRFAIDPGCIPQVLLRIAADLTCYYLQKSNLQAMSEESHQAIWKNSIALLEKITTGIIKIDQKEQEDEHSIWSQSTPFEYTQQQGF